jgi:addiction module RelE/StbE family toxin
MHRLYFGRSFLGSAKKLEGRLKPKLKASLDILAKDPFNPKLHTKPLTGKLADYYSYRLGRDYRVVFRFISINAIHLIRVGHRKDIYR